MPNSRRTKIEMAGLKAAIYDLCNRYKPMTVRQLFYALVVNDLIDKTEAEYKQVVCRLTKEMRLAGELPWNWLVDNTRWMHKPDTYGDLADFMAQAALSYRRALWDPRTNPNYVEVWLEKDALTGVFYEVTEEFDVPLMPCRGYPSLSFLRQAAETLVRQLEARLFREPGKLGIFNATIYYFGDFDPTGVDISRNIEERLRDFMDEIMCRNYAEVLADECLLSHNYLTFERVAVNEDQITTMGLLTRPTKKSDSRSKSFGEESVELDAIPPDVLRDMIRECLEKHVDQAYLEAIAKTEELERQTLKATKLVV